VHWHLGAEHLSAGEYDESGVGPETDRRQLAEEDIRLGFRCKLYDATDSKFTTPFEWQHCIDMVVGETYEVHWPHSAAGACGTLDQYQTPFYDGVFCTDGILNDTAKQIGVQSQVFTIVNDEAFYYPDLMRGMIVDGEKGADIAKYTGSTTGTTRNNEVCSQFAPITWQVDRKCHLVSASSFDKMCADMKAQRDDMSEDLHAHGSRELVADNLAANNHQNLRRG
jgi:Delta carbonic anhydrase